MIKKYYIWALAILTLVMGIGGYQIILSFYPHHALHWYALIPGYFFIVGLILYFLNRFSQKQSDTKRLLWYMAGRMMKLMFSILFLIIYSVLIDVDTKEFLITFGVYYLVYMIFDTIFFYKAARKVL